MCLEAPEIVDDGFFFCGENAATGALQCSESWHISVSIFQEEFL